MRRGWAVQSFGYCRWLPLGRPEVLAHNLDRWGVDEILVQVIDRSVYGTGPDLALLGRLGKMGLSTPLIYAGGIRSVADADRVVSSAADRICVDTLLHDSPEEVERVSRHLGAQAVIGAVPLSNCGGSAHWLNHRDRKASPVPTRMTQLFRARVLSEALVIDWRNEGMSASFDESLLDCFDVPDVPLIAFGGLSETEQLRRVLSSPRVAAAAIGNFFNYNEHAVQHYRQRLAGIPLRPASYQSMR